jgi:hypothetical protein
VAPGLSWSGGAWRWGLPVFGDDEVDPTEAFRALLDDAGGADQALQKADIDGWTAVSIKKDRATVLPT